MACQNTIAWGSAAISRAHVGKQNRVFLPKDSSNLCYYTEGPMTSTAVHQIEILSDLNSRIARLAGALRIPLDTAAAIQQALVFAEATPPGGIERRTESERRIGVRLASSPERRTNSQRFELRGLLVLRFSTEVKLVEILGAEASRQIIDSLASQAERHGAVPGAGDE